MKRLKLSLAVTARALSFAPAVPAADQADALLRRAATAMGADNLKTLRYAGKGMGASFGQAFVPGMAWPKLNYSSYERQLDYVTVFTSEVVMRGRAEPKGGGAVASATHAWNLARLNLQVDRILPLHGRMVPLAELNRMVRK